MASIRGKGNKDTEIALAKFFRRNEITGWRRSYNVFGKPDFVFPVVGLAVFVDGCFWHGCPVHGTRPKQNREFWDLKIKRNKARDRKVTKHLRGIRVEGAESLGA